MPAKVYLLMQPSVRRDGVLPDLTPLAAFGEVVTVLHGSEDPRFKSAYALEMIRRRLAEFDPEHDYVVHAGGDSLGVFLAGTVLADLSSMQGWQRFRWLRWERGRDPETGQRTNAHGSYTPIWVDLTDQHAEATPHAR